MITLSVDGKRGFELQEGGEGDFAGNIAQQAVIRGLIIGRTRHVGNRVGNVGTVEVVVILSRVFFIPDFGISGGVDY